MLLSSSHMVCDLHLGSHLCQPRHKLGVGWGGNIRAQAHVSCQSQSPPLAKAEKFLTNKWSPGACSLRLLRMNLFGPTHDSRKTKGWGGKTSCKVCLLTCCTQGNIFLKGWNSWLLKGGREPVGNLITDGTKVKNKALPMRMLPKTMGPLNEMQLSRDNNPPRNSARSKYYSIAILAAESLFTGQLRAKPSVKAPGSPRFADEAFTFQEGPPGRKKGGHYLSREQIPFYTAWEGKLSFPRNRTPQLKGDRPLQ